MPFTFSHPAAVIPFLTSKKSYFSTSGLIIGSLSPDFEYFIRMQVKSHYSHTYLGILYFDLPIAILIGVIFHLFIKNLLVNNLPHYFQRRVWRFLEVDTIDVLKKNKLKFVFSILIGALTHVVWDDFTHSEALFVNWISFLEHNIYDIPIYRWCQHLSSVIGILICFMTFHRLKIDNKNLNSNILSRLKYWVGVSIICIVVIIIWFLVQDAYWYMGDIVAAIISALFFAFFVMGFIDKKARS